MDGKDDEEGGAPSDDDEGSGSEDSNSDDSKDIDSDDSKDSDGGDNSSNGSDSEGSDSEDYGSQDNSNDRGEPPDDREDEDAGAFYEDNSNDKVDYYDEDIEDYEEAIGGDNDEYPYGRPSDWSCITDVSPKLGLWYEKYGREIPEFGSFHNSEFGSLTTYIDEEDDIDARLALLDRNLMIHSFRNLTLENLEDEDERMECSELEYFLQYVYPSNKRRQDLFGEWMDSIEQLDGYVFDKSIDMEVDGESPDYMDEDPRELMLKKEGTHWELAAIIEATTELKN